MKLKEYELEEVSGKRFIKFDLHNLKNLELLLNNNLTIDKNLSNYITKIGYLIDNWHDLDYIVQIQYSGYWDWEILREFNVTGKWFTFGGSEDIVVYICKSTQKIYIENQILESLPKIEMSLLDFFDVLKQWKEIQGK